ncbi:type II secretion protein F [Aeromicrobium sp. A1-2]|uniref:type II secretion system F family protein n=1 Tax=Aeromicrobium sp. A1-2 TaxID=2107713 RepID=UPI000E496A79|nr:type II secretion system F family protein [Aeromicrobium sp. A1-2]AXT86019.1 type II secretion protein F [Aeromicrobium sp. A1-2]
MALLFGMAVLATFAVFVFGWRLARADALEGWDVADIALLRDEAQRKRRVGILERIARRTSPQLAVVLGPRIIANLRRRIDLAGRPDGMTVDTFLQLLVKYIIVLGGAGVYMMILGRLVSALLLVAAGVIMPLSRLAGARRRRQTQIDADLPDFLDVLAVTVGAGIGFRSAMDRVSTRFTGPLREELTLTLHQLDVGVPRRSAFTQLRDRCDTDAMSSFVSALLQAEELGAPLGEALNSIARDSRREAAQSARQRAARMNPRVTLIVSVILVPPTLVLIGVGMFLGADIDFGSLLNG